MYERTLAKVIEAFSQEFKVLLLTGKRQIGKTTLLEELVKNKRPYVTLDNPKLRNLAKSDPELFLTEKGRTLSGTAPFGIC